jgi:acyl-CoA thioesterase
MQHYGFSDNIGVEDIGFVNEEDGQIFPAPKYKVGLALKPEHLNGNGLLHGGVVSTLLDACMARVFFLGLPKEEMAELKYGVTVEMKINFLRSAREGYVHALGTMIRRGRTISYTEGELFDQHRNLLAKSSATMMIVRRESSES